MHHDTISYKKVKMQKTKCMTKIYIVALNVGGKGYKKSKTSAFYFIAVIVVIISIKSSHKTWNISKNVYIFLEPIYSSSRSEVKVELKEMENQTHIFFHFSLRQKRNKERKRWKEVEVVGVVENRLKIHIHLFSSAVHDGIIVLHF